LLRLIAGFYSADEGKIRFDGKDVGNLSPTERGIGMVFQNCAIWPHMTVFDNAARAKAAPGPERGNQGAR
jgi:ABC-type sugar transport system ATPase subunit